MLSCAALFRHHDLEHNHRANIVKSVCLLHGFLIEVLKKNLDVYHMKEQWLRAIKLARVTVTAAVVLQVLLFGSGATCLFVIDLEILWLLPSLMLWTRFALAVVLFPFGTRSTVQRPLRLNVAFYGITAVASSCLAVPGIILHWQLTFVEQYLFLQVLFVWSTYRLSAVIQKSFQPRTVM